MPHLPQTKAHWAQHVWTTVSLNPYYWIKRSLQSHVEEFKKTPRDQVELAMGLSKFIQELHTKDWLKELVLI